MIKPCLWGLYSKNFRHAILRPVAFGLLTEKLAADNNFFFAKASYGSYEQGNRIDIFLFINPQNGLIADARYLAYGYTALIGAAECACHAIRGRPYTYASALSLDLFRQEITEFPEEVSGHVLLVLEVLHEAVAKAAHIKAGKQPFRYPDFIHLPPDEQRRIVTTILDDEIRPFLAQDEGGVDLIAIRGTEIVIVYSGACAHCYASGGSTLSYIQDVFRRYLGDEIVVRPEISPE